VIHIALRLYQWISQEAPREDPQPLRQVPLLSALFDLACLKLAFCEIDLLLATRACMLSIEFVRKDLFLLAAIRTLADK
jgi:hypothetical protein